MTEQNESRLELECICNTCNIHFTLWNNWVPKESGDGIHISEFVCPNCEQKDLDFDIMRCDIPQ